MKSDDRTGRCREQSNQDTITEIVLGLLSTLIVVRGFVDLDRNMVLWGVVCLAGLIFEVLNKRWANFR